MSSVIYSHMSPQPTGSPAQVPTQHGHVRLDEAVDTIRQEVEVISSDSDVLPNQRDRYGSKGSHTNVEKVKRLSPGFFDDSLHSFEADGIPPSSARQHDEDMKLQKGRPPGVDVSKRLPSGFFDDSPHHPVGEHHISRPSARQQKDEVIELQEGRPTVVDVPSTEGEPRNVSAAQVQSKKSGARKAENASAGSSRFPQGSVAQQPPVLTTFWSGVEDPYSVPPELKKEGSDWFAVFNGNDNGKRVLDVSLEHTLMHESIVSCVRFSADGKYLATGCNHTAQIYDTKTGIKTSVFTDESPGIAGDMYIRSVCFSPDGKYLATGAEDKLIRVWDIAKKRIRNVFDGHQKEVYSLDFSLDGRLIVSGSGDKTVRIWDMVDASSKVLTINDTDPVNNDAGVTSVAISPSGQLIAAGNLDAVVRIWDVATGMLIERLVGHRDCVYSVAFTSDEKVLISGSLDKTLKYWDVSGLFAKRKEPAANADKNVKGSQCTMDFLGHSDYVISVAVSHDKQWIVSGSKDHNVQFWDAHTGTPQCMLQGHKYSVLSVDLTPERRILATDSDDSQEQVDEPPLLATGSGDRQARIWSYTNIEDARRKPTNIKNAHRIRKDVHCIPPRFFDDSRHHPHSFARHHIPHSSPRQHHVDGDLRSFLGRIPSLFQRTHYNSHGTTPRPRPLEWARHTPASITESFTPASSAVKTRLHTLSNWWPIHTGRAPPTPVSVPHTKGNLRNAAAGAPKGNGGYRRDEEFDPLPTSPTQNPNPQQPSPEAQTNIGEHGSGRLCFCL